jgi:hypothetical protein
MIGSQHGRRVFALQVAGLKYRYHSHPPPSSSNLDANIASGVTYVDIESIGSIGSFSASIDPSGGVATYGATSITLNIDKRRGGLSDPGIIFGRCGARSASTRVRLTSSVNRTDTTFNIDTDLRATGIELLHIGAETVKLNSATVSSISVTRGIGNTPTQTHSLSLEGSFVPELTTEITTFRGRRAKLYMAHRYANGNTSDYVEVINGFIEQSPKVEEGDQISLSIMPLTALIDTDLSDKGISQTRLLQDYHYFDGVMGSALEYALSLEVDTDNRNVELFPDTTAAITANTFQVSVETRRGYQSYLDDFDPSLPQGPDGDDYIREHPRYPKLRRDSDAIFEDDGVYPNTLTYDGSIPGYVINSDGALTNALDSAEITATNKLRVWLPSIELKQHLLGSGEVKKWPNVINDTLESDGPSNTQGLDGGVARWRLQAGPTFRAEKLSGSPFQASVWLWNTRAHYQYLLDGLAVLGVRGPLCWKTSGTNTALDTLARCSYPLDLGNDGDPYSEDFTVNTPVQAKRIFITSVESTAVFKVRDIPKAYYQHYESAILVEGSLGLPSSATADEFYYVTVQHYDRNLGGERRQVFKVTHETVATFGGSNVGYLIHIADDNNHNQNSSFGDWTDSERALIFRGGQFIGERPGTVLLKLLESGGGDGINGVYDVLSLGLNISSDDIDEASFLTVDSTATFTLSDSYAGDGVDLRDTIDAMLRLMGAVLVMKRDETSGRSKLSLVALGNERLDASINTISAEQWLSDQPPKWGVHEDIVTQIKFEFDFDASEESFKSEVIFNNQEAINRYGGERSAITLALPGVNSEQFGRGAGDNFSYFLPTAARIFNLLSNPLRTWVGSIGTGQSTFLDVGSYVTVSSPHLRGYSDSYGVVNGIGMVRAIRQEFMNEGCDLEMVVTGLAPVYWNATAKVTSITLNSVTVASSEYSSSSVDDVTFFEVGDVVDYLPLGNHDGAITGLEIESITGNVITFTANHGISSLNGTLEPTTYANASNNHRSDAYLANASDIINTTVDAQEFS